MIVSVNLKGTVYKIGMVLCGGINDDGEPTLLKIKSITNKPEFLCHGITAQYCYHLHSYVIDQLLLDNEEVSVVVDSLRNQMPMNILRVDDKLIVSQRAAFI